MAVEVRLRRDRLVISNPGGLYGITVDRLGREAVTSARNPRLVSICQHVRMPETGGRVIEALATGIPMVTSALAEAGLPPARYVDAGIRFTAVLRRTRPAVPLTDMGKTESVVLDALDAGPRSTAELHQAVGLSAPNIRKALRALRHGGLVEQIGGRGKPTVYRRIASSLT